MPGPAAPRRGERAARTSRMAAIALPPARMAPAATAARMPAAVAAPDHSRNVRRSGRGDRSGEPSTAGSGPDVAGSELGAGAGRSIRISHRSATAPISPASTDGSHHSGPASGRVIATTPPTTPKAATTTNPHGGRRASSQPAVAARTSTTMPMPTRSAILSAVPKRAIAVSFAQDGARSMRAPPIATNGPAPGAQGAAMRSASPAPSATEATPAIHVNGDGMPRSPRDGSTMPTVDPARAPGVVRGETPRQHAATRLIAWEISSTATAPLWRRARPPRAVPAFDEMFGSPAHPGALAESRDAYRELYQALAQMTQEELRGRTDSLASSYLAQGVTFDFAGEERPFPLDAVPRVITYDEWSRIERGVKQRVRALEAFLDDAYGRQHCVRDEVLPAGLIASSQYFYRQAAGIHSANGVRIQVSGIDLIRDEHGEMRVLEDNVRVPSGVSYVISNRRVMAQTLPELFVSMRVRPVGDYPNKLLAALRASAPAGIEEPERRRADARRLQLGVLRAHAARASDGRRARRGPRPAVHGRQGVHAHHPWPQARRRHLPPRRRRVPRPAAVPRRLDARRPRAHARRASGQCHDRQRGGQRRRRRQAPLHLRAGPDPLLPGRRAHPQERRHLAPRRPGRSGRGARPPRRARGQACRRLGRQGPRGGAGCLARRARQAAHAAARRPARLDRAAGRDALDHPDARRGRDASAPRRPAALRGQRRRRRLGASRRPHPRGPSRRTARRELEPGRRVEGHLGDRRFRSRSRRVRAGPGGLRARRRPGSDDHGIHPDHLRRAAAAGAFAAGPLDDPHRAAGAAAAGGRRRSPGRRARAPRPDETAEGATC